MFGKSYNFFANLLIELSGWKHNILDVMQVRVNLQKGICFLVFLLYWLFILNLGPLFDEIQQENEKLG